MFFIRRATVIGPTPPGTGVIYPACSEASWKKQNNFRIISYLSGIKRVFIVFGQNFEIPDIVSSQRVNLLAVSLQ